MRLRKPAGRRDPGPLRVATQRPNQSVPKPSHGSRGTTYSSPRQGAPTYSRNDIGYSEEWLVDCAGEPVRLDAVTCSTAFDQGPPILSVIVGSTTLDDQRSDRLGGQPGHDRREAFGSSTTMEPASRGLNRCGSRRPGQGGNRGDDVIAPFGTLVSPVDPALASESQSPHARPALGVMIGHDDGGEKKEAGPATTQALVQIGRRCHGRRLAPSFSTVC